MERLAEEDREYLQMMYEEHVEHSRKHEDLRGTVTGIIIGLAGALLAFAFDHLDKPGVGLAATGWLITMVSVLGALLNFVHGERARQHNIAAGKFRHAIEEGVSSKYTGLRPPFQSGWPSLFGLWIVIFVLSGAFGLGIGFVGGGSGAHWVGL